MIYWICNKCGMLNEKNKLTCRNCENTKVHMCLEHGLVGSQRVQFKSAEERDNWIKLARKKMGAKVWYSP